MISIMNSARVSLLVLVLVNATNRNAAKAAIIGIDSVHGHDSLNYLATGTNFTSFRSVITDMGNTIVPLTSFGTSDLMGLDAVILKMPYSTNVRSYSASAIAAVTAFANQKAVFLSDSDLWKNAGFNDRPITFGDNQRLLQNVISYTASGHAAIFIADTGNGAMVENFNALVASYGVSYALTGTDVGGRTITGFVPHPITAGVSQIGVDFQLPLTIHSPSTDLTNGSGQDNVLAVYTVPEPATAWVLTCAAMGFRGRRVR